MLHDVIDERGLAKLAGWPVEVVRAFRAHGDMLAQVPHEGEPGHGRRAWYDRRKAMAYIKRQAQAAIARIDKHERAGK